MPPSIVKKADLVRGHDTRSVGGNINLLGGITQNIRRAVGTYTTDYWGNLSIQHGFNKRYRYDERLMQMFPPFFLQPEDFQSYHGRNKNIIINLGKDYGRK